MELMDFAPLTHGYTDTAEHNHIIKFSPISPISPMPRGYTSGYFVSGLTFYMMHPVVKLDRWRDPAVRPRVGAMCILL